MPKVIEVKFLRVAWDLAPQRGIYLGNGKYNPPHDSDSVMRERGLDAAHEELEECVKEWLVDGWTMEGPVAYINADKGGGSSGYSHLVQKMVRYEEEKSGVELGIRRKPVDTN